MKSMSHSVQHIPQHLCCLQVMFFVGVQLDVTAPPTPKASIAAHRPAQAPCAGASAAMPTERSAADREQAGGASSSAQASGAAQQQPVLLSPAASQQVQSQVGQKQCSALSTACLHICRSVLLVLHFHTLHSVVDHKCFISKVCCVLNLLGHECSLCSPRVCHLG